MKKVIFLVIVFLIVGFSCEACDEFIQNYDNIVKRKKELLLDESLEDWLRDIYVKDLVSLKEMKDSCMQKKKEIEACSGHNGKTWKEFIHGYGFDVSLDVVIFDEKQMHNTEICMGIIKGPPEFDFRKPPKDWNRFIKSMDTCFGFVADYYSQNPNAKIINLHNYDSSESIIWRLEELYRCNLEIQKKKKTINSL